MGKVIDATQVVSGHGIASEGVDEDKILGKILRRIVPFLFVYYVVSYLDRVNVGFAALTMNRDIVLTPTAFGIGAGLFFFGYFIAEIPSNLIMMKVGARIWIARIMITWGIVSALTAFVTGPVQFGIARFLLGIGEAGFVPGVFLYLTMWFPAAARARATSLFLLGIPIANIFGSPISGMLITLEGMGLKGWQWLLILEAIPAVFLGVACLFVLTDRPDEARWLTDPERGWLVNRLAAEKAAIEEKKHHFTLAQALRNWRVLILAVINFCSIIGSLGVGLWLPLRRRGRAGGQHDRHLAGGHYRGPVRGGGRHQLLHGDVLGRSGKLPDRRGRGRRHCHDRVDRQPRRLRRSLHDRADQGYYADFHHSAAGGRRLSAVRVYPDGRLRPAGASGSARRGRGGSGLGWRSTQSL
jgi:Major Facilitator Superfamily